MSNFTAKMHQIRFRQPAQETRFKDDDKIKQASESYLQNMQQELFYLTGSDIKELKKSYSEAEQSDKRYTCRPTIRTLREIREGGEGSW